jgi:hypothetical protein
MKNSRSQLKLGFLTYMNWVYFGLIAIIFLVIFVSIGELPKNSGGLKLLIFFSGFVQIAILINLIVLNDKSIKNSISSVPESKSLIENGLYEEFHDNGKLKVKGMMKDGVKDGIWEYYVYDGTFQRTKKFENGKEI